MINFRFHVVSLIAVFLALAIGVIMGSAVIDRAVVDRLERQQQNLNDDIRAVQEENGELTRELRDLRESSETLADEGSERLLQGTLLGVAVLFVAPQGATSDGLDDLVELVRRAGADYRGTLVLTDRFRLDGEDERRDLAEALGLRLDSSAGTLRAAALIRLTRALRPAAVDAAAGGEEEVVPALRIAGFLDYRAPEGVPDSFAPLVPGVRLVAVSGPDAAVADARLMVPFVRGLVAPRPDRQPLPVVAVTGAPPEEGEVDAFLGPLREDAAISARLSTVDDIDDFAGRVATVLAVDDLSASRFGHYGRGPAAQRLLPAPVP